MAIVLRAYTLLPGIENSGASVARGTIGGIRRDEPRPKRDICASALESVIVGADQAIQMGGVGGQGVLRLVVSDSAENCLERLGVVPTTGRTIADLDVDDAAKRPNLANVAAKARKLRGSNEASVCENREGGVLGIHRSALLFGPLSATTQRI